MAVETEQQWRRNSSGDGEERKRLRQSVKKIKQNREQEQEEEGGMRGRLKMARTLANAVGTLAVFKTEKETEQNRMENRKKERR